MIQKRLAQVQARIGAAARISDRNPQEVSLIAVTKGVAVEKIREALASGVREVGENRVQEAQEKQAVLGTVPMRGQSLRWHLIGHLQRNKVKFAVEMFDCIHSVDSLELVEALDRQVATQRTGQRANAPTGKLEVLIQVNVSGEATKFGCSPDQTERLAQAIVKSQRLKFSGLMTMAPFSSNPEDSRPFFQKLRELRDDMQEKFSSSSLVPRLSPLGLSMGMTQDFEVAIQEGATMVRVGRSIFGERVVQ